MKERLEKLLKTAGDYSVSISSWEENFLHSLRKQTEKGKALSPKQLDVLHRIESKVEKMRKGDPAWECIWDEEKASNFKIAVSYYKASPERYFSQILDWFAHNPDKIPPQNYYKKIVENKYAQKVITNLTKAPKYPVGSTVMLRATARQGVTFQVMEKFRTVPLFVLKPTNRAISAANGCRIYSLLSSTSSEVIEVEERWIKKWKAKDMSKTARDMDIPF